MKNLKFTLFSLFLILSILSTHMSQGQLPPDGCAWIYESCNYTGHEITLCGNVDFLAFINFQNKLSSIKLGKGIIVTLFDENRYTGQLLDVTNDIPCLTGNYMDKKTNSMKIRPAVGCIWVYTNCPYTGNRNVYCSNVSSLSDGISSIMAGDRTQFTLYDNTNYGGVSYQATGSIDCLTSVNFNDKVNSIIVESSVPNEGCVWLYSDCNFGGTRKQYCTNISALGPEGFNDMVSSIRVGYNTKIQLFSNGSYGGDTLTLLSDNNCLVNDNFNDKLSSFKLFALSTFEEKLEAAVGRYSPVLYMDKDEKHYPVKLENMGLQWQNVQLDNTSAKVTYNYNAGLTLNPLAPYYVKIKNNPDGSINLIYSIIFAYNDCGPQATVTAEVYSNIGKSGITDQIFSLCPAGVHNGDIEHAVVTIDKTNFQVLKVNFAYHSWNKDFSYGDIEWEGTHPVGFIAKGSHALYSKAEKNLYLELWNKQEGTYSTCAATCHTIFNIPYPCTRECWIGAKTSGYFFETTSRDNRWSPPVKILASDFYTISSLSIDESNMLIYQGRLGVDIVNNDWENTKSTIRTTCWPVFQVCSNCEAAVNYGLSAGDSEMQSAAPTSLATKGWWK